MLGYPSNHMQYPKQNMPTNVRVSTVTKTRQPATSCVYTIELSYIASEEDVASKCSTLKHIHVQGEHYQTKRQRICRPAQVESDCSDDWTLLLQQNITELKKMSKSGLEANLSILKSNVLIESDLGLFDV